MVLSSSGKVIDVFVNGFVVEDQRCSQVRFHKMRVDHRESFADEDSRMSADAVPDGAYLSILA
jgi:hypothetical protein